MLIYIQEIQHTPIPTLHVYQKFFPSLLSFGFLCQYFSPSTSQLIFKIFSTQTWHRFPLPSFLIIPFYSIYLPWNMSCNRRNPTKSTRIHLKAIYLDIQPLYKHCTFFASASPINTLWMKRNFRQFHGSLKKARSSLYWYHIIHRITTINLRLYIFWIANGNNFISYCVGNT